MREGLNPEKDKILPESGYQHQVVIPIFIPNLQDYFRDSKKVLMACLKSLHNSIHNQTFITVVNNGSCNEIVEFLEKQKDQGNIHEVIHTGPIGKLNAVMKGIIGHNFPFITITDSDILFKPEWQKETARVFNAFPKCGMVGLIPQYNMFSNFCTNTLFDTFWNKNVFFIKVLEPKEMKKFYESLGWKMEVGHPYLEYAPAIQKRDGIKAYIGSSHVAATYRRELFEEIPRFFEFRMGGDSERYLDKLAQKKDLWKLTTINNYAYHMGNVWEEWMDSTSAKNSEIPQLKPLALRKNYPGRNLIKNRIFKKILRIHKINQLFFRYKKLPKSKLGNYSRIFY